MDYFSKYKRQLVNRSFLAIFVPVILTVAAGFLGSLLGLDTIYVTAIMLVAGLCGAIVMTIIISTQTSKPIEVIGQVLTYASHSNRDSSAPSAESLIIARELVESISSQIYELASSSNTTDSTNPSVATTPTNSNLFDHLSLPVFGIHRSQKVTIVNRSAAEFLGKTVADIAGKPLYDSLQLTFQDNETFDTWLGKITATAVTGSHSWTKVRHIPLEGEPKQFDLTASFSSGNESGTETMLVLFDKTAAYDDEDQQVDFVALAVHELRTPLTIMRGYIEVFEDELGPTLSPELTQFMYKMHASAQQLTAFVGNILNVARVEENQLSLKLRSESWPDILKMAIEDLQMRAHVHGITIELQIAQDLPAVAVDRISIHEVLNNLVDNAIKYSEQSNKIIITSQINADGLVETSVQDFGIGMPPNVVNELFQKFYRSHKSNVRTGGTGLGLYISKALVNAHGGNIWVRSKEGEGSIFSFTILPYDKLSSEKKAGEDDIIRGAHGWIKNHSLYRQ